MQVGKDGVDAKTQSRGPRRYRANLLGCLEAPFVGPDIQRGCNDIACTEPFPHPGRSPSRVATIMIYG